MRYVYLVTVMLALTGCQASDKLPEQCYLKPQSGHCRAAIERYWFDSESGTCKAFIWGGCGGTVPFETMQECQSMCTAPAEEAEPGMRQLQPRGY